MTYPSQSIHWELLYRQETYLDPPLTVFALRPLADARQQPQLVLLISDFSRLTDVCI